MRKSICSLALMLLPALLLAGCGSSGPTAPTVQSRGIVQGMVLAGNGSAVAGADVLVDDKATGVETDDSGYFEVSVTPGEHLITVVADGVKSRPYAVEGSGNREIVIEIVPGEAPPMSDEEFCRLYPRECEEPPKDEPPKDKPPMSDEEFCELYPWECEEPPKDEPPMSDEEFCELYPWECEEPK
jgi:hypothetical protein